MTLLIRRFLITLPIIITLSLYSGFNARAEDIPRDEFIYLPIVYSNYDPLWSFQDPKKITLVPTPFSDPMMVIDSSGRPHIFWDTYSTSPQFIYHTYRAEEGWTTPQAVAPSLGVSKLLNLPVVGNVNDIHLVWKNDLKIGGPYRILYASFNGSSWGPEFELIGQGQNIYNDGMVRLDSKGNPSVALVESDGFFNSKIYFRSWTGNGFSARQEIPKPTYSSQVWLDSDAGVRFYGDGYYDSSVYFSYWKQGSFQITNRKTPGRLNSRPGLLDRQGNLHFIRSASVPIPGGNTTGVYHQCLNKDISFLPETILSGTSAIQNLRRSFDEQLQIMAAWTTNDHQTVHAAFWDGCSLTSKKELALPAVPNSGGWSNLIALAKNGKAQAICLLSREKYSSNNYLLLCNR